MKKSLLAALAVVLLASAASFAGHFTETLPPAAAYGATAVSNGYDYQLSTDSGAPSITAANGISLWSRTAAQINALAPLQAGQILFCSNCTNSPVCVSSGTGTGAWIAAMSSGTVSGVPHCQ